MVALTERRECRHRCTVSQAVSGQFVRAIVFYEGSIACAIKCNFCARKCINWHKSICSIFVGAVSAQYIVVVTVDAECPINFM